MSVTARTPGQIYLDISREVERILGSLAQTSQDPALQQTNEDARRQLALFHAVLADNMASLTKNAEWDRFTIAFYGETNAGKSTVIETLRIMLAEESKQERRQAFQTFQRRHQLTHADIEALQQRLDENETTAAALADAVSGVEQAFLAQETALQQQLDALKAEIADQHLRNSLWRKFCNLFIKTPAQQAYLQLAASQQAISSKKADEIAALASEQACCQARHQELTQLRSEQGAQLAELATLADGEIIGSGVSDFTLDTVLYPFDVYQQRFALLDVPGIEGKESKVLAQIQQAVEKAHAVFYVTSKATAPQKGDEQNPGTLEKIKAHLNAQTEVWTLFNKRITNPLQLNRPQLLSDDERQSLDDLDSKMREQLGEHYRETYSLSALPAFLSVASHLAPGSETAKKRDRLLEQIEADRVLDKTGMSDFLHLLTRQLVADSKEKIARSNFNKARKTVEELTTEIALLQQDTYHKLAKQLHEDMLNAQQLLDMALASLKSRLLNHCEEAVNDFRNRARKQVYAEVDRDISNDAFKSALEDSIKQQHTELEQALAAVFNRELQHFRTDVDEIVQRFQKYAEAILATYAKLQRHQFDRQFELKIDIDSGLKLTSLLATLVGGALLLWNPAGWIVLAPALAGMVFAFYKAVRGFFSSDYKMSQQRQAADENLSKITGKLKTSVSQGIEEAFPEITAKITQLKSLLEEPASQASHINKILIDAADKLRQLSGNLAAPGAL